MFPILNDLGIDYSKDHETIQKLSNELKALIKADHKDKDSWIKDVYK